MIKLGPKIIKLKRLIVETSKSCFLPNTISCIGIGGMGNFGDILNIKLVEFLTNRKVIKARYSFVDKFKSKFNIGENYAVVGSIVQWSKKNTIIWGAGLISDSIELEHVPKKIYAVRGPLTREIILKKGIDCPEIYGDPALLLPYIYQPFKKSFVYKLGIIPHYVDKKTDWIQLIKLRNDVLVIDIITEDWEKLIDQIVSCKCIISSSLHGIILADAYHVPNLWVEFSNQVMGGGFKFRDYNLSVSKPELKPVKIDSQTEIDDLISLARAWNINFDYKKLIRSCPFNINESKFL